MRGNTKAIASTGQDAVYGSLRFCSRDPERKCTLSARCDDGKWSVPFEMDGPTTEQSLRLMFPIHREPPMLRGLRPIEVTESPVFVPLIPACQSSLATTPDTTTHGCHD